MSKVPQPLFKDIGKRVSDLLTKEFPSEKQEQKAEWKSTTADGVKLEFNVKSENGRTVGMVKNEYKYKPFDANVIAEVNTDREVKVEVSSADKFVKGLKGIFAIQSQNKKSGLEYFETVGFEYRHDLVSATASAEFGRATDNALKGSLVLGTQGVTVGTNVEYLRKQDATVQKELKSSVGYASDEFDAVIYGKVSSRDAKSNTEVGATYYHKLNSDLAVGTEIKFDVTNREHVEKPTLAFGGSYRLSPTSVFKGKYDTAGTLTVSHAQQVNKTAKLLIGASINTADVSGKDATKFGIHLLLNA